MRHVAVIGSGPAGYYTAEALDRKFGDDVRMSTSSIACRCRTA